VSVPLYQAKAESTVIYALAGGDVADLMRCARRILTEMLTGRHEPPAELRDAGVRAS
jgi:ArsR family transcriptional regulator